MGRAQALKAIAVPHRGFREQDDGGARAHHLDHPGVDGRSAESAPPVDVDDVLQGDQLAPQTYPRRLLRIVDFLLGDEAQRPERSEHRHIQSRDVICDDQLLRRRTESPMPTHLDSEAQAENAVKIDGSSDAQTCAGPLGRPPGRAEGDDKRHENDEKRQETGRRRRRDRRGCFVSGRLSCHACS